MNEPNHAMAREFRIAVEYRRCAWYVLIGSGVLASVQALLYHQSLLGKDFTFGRVALLAVFLVAPSICLLVAVYTWHIQVDETGITRRRFWFWDVWKWEEFQSGKITLSEMGYLDRSRSLLRNILVTDYLEKADRTFVRGLCNFYLGQVPKPESAPVAGELTCRYMLFCWFSVKPEGIAGNTFDCDWGNVKEVRVIVETHDEPVGLEIHLVLPNQMIKARAFSQWKTSGEGKKVWPKRKVIPPRVIEYLQAYVPAQKMKTYAKFGPALSLEECEYRKKAIMSQLSGITWGARILPNLWFVGNMVAIGGPAILQLFRKPLGQLQWWEVLAFVCAALMVIAMPLALWGVARSNLISLQQQLQELEKQRASLDSQS